MNKEAPVITNPQDQPGKSDMRIKKVTFNDILFLVALYSNLFSGYHYVQTLKEEHRKKEALINEMCVRLGC